MALQVETVVAAAQDPSVNSGKNYYTDEPVYIKKLDGQYADIFDPSNNAIQILQDGFANRTDENGEFSFAIEAGEYIVEIRGLQRRETYAGADYFNNRIEETVNQIVSELSSSRGFRVVGDFSSGFTYELPNDVGLDDDGNAWIYSDPDALPFTVNAATTPSAPDYTQVTFNSADAIGNKLDYAGAVDRKLSDILSESVSIADFLVAGTTNVYQAFQAAADTGRNIRIPSGTYTLDTADAVQLKAGQIVIGAGPKNFSESEYTEVVNNNVGGGCFHYTNDSSTGQKQMPALYNMTLQADYPVKFNDEETAVILDGPGSNVPYGMRPKLINCDITPRVQGVGIGVSWSKMFDGSILYNEIDGFSINVLLNGSDLNEVKHNRIRNGYDYHILELSATSFGSQNEIQHNDILKAGSTGCVFYKTTSRHTRFYDNYLEQASGGSGTGLKGFIDISSVDAPAFGGNTSNERFSAIVRDNRIDGQDKASDFVYRLEPDGMVNCDIKDTGTTGNQLFVSKSLILIDSAGNEIDSLPILYNPLNAASYNFSGQKFGKWDGFKSKSERDLHVDGESIFMFSSELSSNNANNFLRSSGKILHFLNGFTSNVLLSYNKDEDDGFFTNSSTYQIIFEARCVSGSETLSFANTLNGSGASFGNFAITNDFQKYVYEFKSGDLDTDVNGVYFKRSNNGSDIEIKSIEIVKKYNKEFGITQVDSTVFSVSQTNGKIYVKADGANTFPAYKVYDFVNDVAIESAAFATDPAVIDIDISQSGKDLTISVTGTGGNKRLKIQHNPNV